MRASVSSRRRRTTTTARDFLLLNSVKKTCFIFSLLFFSGYSWQLSSLLTHHNKRVKLQLHPCFYNRQQRLPRPMLYTSPHYTSLICTIIKQRTQCIPTNIHFR